MGTFDAAADEFMQARIENFFDRRVLQAIAHLPQQLMRLGLGAILLGEAGEIAAQLDVAGRDAARESFVEDQKFGVLRPNPGFFGIL